jgi:hypothetical protein
LAAYELMHQVEMVPHSDVVAFVRDRGLHDRGASWIDTHLLASALVARMPLWTADPRLATVAGELGVAYEP